MDTDKVKSLIKKYSGNHFTKYIRGKRVAIVGPDTALQGKNLGKYIDGFDVVIRHNTVFDFLPLKPEVQQDFGSRTDVLYLSPTCIKNYAFKGQTLQKLKQNKVKFIVYQNGNKNHRYLTGDYCFPQPLAWFKRNAARAGTKLHYSHHTTHALTEMMNRLTKSGELTVPRTGFISIFDMLIHEAKEIEILGMSFYHGGGHAFRPDVKGELNPLADHKGHLDSPHDSYIELELMREFWRDYQKIKMDPKLFAIPPRQTDEESDKSG